MAAPTATNPQPTPMAALPNGAGGHLEPSLSQSAVTNEQREALLRLKRCFVVGMLMWPLYTPLDFLAAQQGASLAALLTVRVTVQLALVLLFLMLRLRPSPAGVMAIEILAFAAVSAGLGLHALLGPGFRAATFTSTFTTLVVHGLILPSHWKRGLWRTAVPALLPPLFLVLTYSLRPELRRDFDDPVLTAELLAYMGSYFAVWIVVLYAGNITWELRRQIHQNKLIGRYKLIERVGKGGMGEVWRAWHPTLKTEVALKLTTRQGDHELHRFEREIKALTSITHPGVVKIFDCGVTEEGFIFYTMELLHGQTLRQRLEDDDRPFAIVDAAAVVVDIADALHAAHAKGIIHRDIKPENILLVPTSSAPSSSPSSAPSAAAAPTTWSSSSSSSSDSAQPGRVQAKLIDFGIAKSQTAADLKSGTLTQTGAILGTPLYLAPEQALGADVDARADVYALGAVLYTCLTGRPPFVEQTLTAMLLAHAQKVPAPPSLLVSGIPAALDDVVLRCLQKKPADRYPSARAFAEALAVAVAPLGLRSVAAARFPSLAAEAPTVDG